MFCIDLDHSGASACCRLIGRLDAQGAEEARSFLSGRPRPAVVDASQLRFADEAGLALLADLKGSGARLEALSPYLALCLARMEQGQPIRIGTEGRTALPHDEK